MNGQYRGWRRSVFWLLVAGLFICLLVPMEYGLRAYRDTNNTADLRDTLERANGIRALLESEINSAAFLATGVESYIVAREGRLDPREIQRILALVFERGRHFRNIGIAPDNRIAWVFPRAGNEAVIGLDYADLAEQWPGIQEVIAEGEGRLSGPVELVQGGRGLIYRAPIQINGEYWGLLSTVIDADSVFEYLRAIAGELAPVIALRQIRSDGEPGAVFFGDAALFQRPLELLPVNLPGSRWEMAVQTPMGSRLALGWYRVLEFGLALFLAVMLGLLLRLIWQRNLLRQLDAQVRERTSELSQSHDLLYSVLAAARSFAIVATDARGVIMLFNKGAERMLGYQAEDMVGKQQPGSFLVAEEISQRARVLEAELGRPLQGDEVFTLRAQQGTEEVLMMHYRHRDGRLIPVQTVVSAIKDADGGVRGYLGIAEDISERLRNETLKNQFISTVSHELRTPLTAISGALGLLRAGSLGPVPESMGQMLEIACSNSERLTRLVDDLLDVEKLMAGRMALYPAVHPVAGLVRASLDNLQAMAAQQDVKLVIRQLDGLSVRVDASRFQQVLTNLLSNAIKFSPPGGCVSVEMSQIAGHVRTLVTDQGPGIPAAFHPQLFQRFAQADSGDSRRQSGTGLGLAISKQLTEHMGGRIGYEPGPAGGSCFWVEFPIVEPAVDVCHAGVDSGGPQ